jgi:hypothetical protein
MRMTKWVAGIVMAAAVALTASGCVASPAPSPSPTATSTATPLATPTATPTATSTPTPTPEAQNVDDPADVSTWEITYSGIGPVRLDRPVRDVVAEVASSEQNCKPSVASFFDSSVIAVGDASDPSLIVAATTGPNQGPEGTTRPHTDAGITVGSTFDQLLTAYPDAEAYTDSNGRPGYRLTDDTGWIHFTSVDAQTINIIDVSRVPTDVKEYCG